MALAAVARLAEIVADIGTALASDIDSLILFAGMHPREFGFHRALLKRFPFGVYYLVEEELVRVYAELDLRRDPAWIRRRLTASE